MKPSVAIQKLIDSWSSPSYAMMVGVPGVGKSTFLKKFLALIHEQYFIASTDDILEVEAKRLGLTYSEAFHKVNQKKIKREMEDGIAKAISAGKSIFHDQTNMGRKSRVSKLKNVPDFYKKVCLNFSVDDKVLAERLEARAISTGKIISPFVLKNMFSSYVAPSREEGFDQILEIDNT